MERVYISRNMFSRYAVTRTVLYFVEEPIYGTSDTRSPIEAFCPTIATNYLKYKATFSFYMCINGFLSSHITSHYAVLNITCQSSLFFSILSMNACKVRLSFVHLITLLLSVSTAAGRGGDTTVDIRFVSVAIS